MFKQSVRTNFLLFSAPSESDLKYLADDETDHKNDEGSEDDFHDSLKVYEYFEVVHEI